MLRFAGSVRRPNPKIVAASFVAVVVIVGASAVWMTRGASPGDEDQDPARGESASASEPSDQGSPAEDAGRDSGPSGDSPLDYSGLDSSDDTTRFEAVLRLLESESPRLVERLQAAVDRGDLRDTPDVQESLDFIRWKRSGKPLPDFGKRHTSRPDILLISVDTLRSDHLGAYGYSAPTSPNIDALAESGVLFENAFATSSWTLPSHMSLFTSRYPSFHGADRRASPALPSSVPTLAQELEGLGYATAGIINHPYIDVRWGFDRGFDVYRRDRITLPAEEQTDVALTWLRWHMFDMRGESKDHPIFMFAHYLDPHETYDAPPPFEEYFTAGYEGALKPTDHLVTKFLDDDFDTLEDYGYALGLYDEEIRYVDHAVGRLLDGFAEVGSRQSTIVVFLSDHGEEFKDHGSMGHKTTLYREQLQIPLIISYPSQINPGQRVELPVSLVDVAPTLLGMMGEAFPSGAQGSDLGPYFAGEDEVPGGDASVASSPSPVFAELGPLDGKWEGSARARSVQTERHKLIWTWDEEERLTKELYDLETDPLERNNLYRTQRHDRDVRAIERGLKEFIDAAKKHAAAEGDSRAPAPPMGERMKAQLKAMGYIQ